MRRQLRVWLTIVGLVGLALAVVYGKGRSDGAARPRAELRAAQTAAAAARLEAAGERASAERVEVVVRQREAVQARTQILAREAAKAEDAHAPLDPLRADRLRAHDLSLCQSAPRLGGCAAPVDARGGEAAVRPASPS
jgi:hypothetical protein